MQEQQWHWKHICRIGLKSSNCLFAFWFCHGHSDKMSWRVFPSEHFNSRFFIHNERNKLECSTLWCRTLWLGFEPDSQTIDYYKNSHQGHCGLFCRSNKDREKKVLWNLSQFVKSPICFFNLVSVPKSLFNKSIINPSIKSYPSNTQSHKTFFSWSLTLRHNKLQCSWKVFFTQSTIRKQGSKHTYRVRHLKVRHSAWVLWFMWKN